MCITQETFINTVMSWYDHYCADANIFILSYLPCWSGIFFTIAFIMWKSFVCKFVLLMLNKFILVHKWFIWMVVICHVFYCILCCICIFYHVLCQKWQNKAVKSINQSLLWSKFWYKAMLHRPISMPSTITFHRRKMNARMCRTGLLMQSGSFKSTIWWCLTMLVRRIAYPDLRTWYTVNSDTIETLFPYSQGVSLSLCRWTMMRYHKLSILGNN